MSPTEKPELTFLLETACDAGILSHSLEIDKLKEKGYYQSVETKTEGRMDDHCNDPYLLAWRPPLLIDANFLDCIDDARKESRMTSISHAALLFEFWTPLADATTHRNRSLRDPSSTIP